MHSNDAFYKTFPVVVLLTAVGGALLWIFASRVYGVSFLLGNATSLYMMSMLHRSSAKLVKMDAAQARRVATRNYILRYGFYALVLLLAGLLDQLDLLTTGLSLFLFKIVFYIILFWDARKERTTDG